MWFWKRQEFRTRKEQVVKAWLYCNPYEIDVVKDDSEIICNMQLSIMHEIMAIKQVQWHDPKNQLIRSLRIKKA